MVSKDQAIGGVICAVCVVIGVLYTVGLFYFGNPLGSPAWPVYIWLIGLPVFIAFIAIMGIGAWIGWTMATTPPPKPIEEITSEIETEEKKAAEEAKPTEEPKKEEPAKEEERKPPERKRRGE